MNHMESTSGFHQHTLLSPALHQKLSPFVRGRTRGAENWVIVAALKFVTPGSRVGSRVVCTGLRSCRTWGDGDSGSGGVGTGSDNFGRQQRLFGKVCSEQNKKCLVTIVAIGCHLPLVALVASTYGNIGIRPLMRRSTPARSANTTCGLIGGVGF